MSGTADREGEALTFGLVGMKAEPLIIKADLKAGPPGVEIVGMREASARESRVRVRSVLAQLRIELPGAIVVTGATFSEPCDLPSSGGLDLPILVATLMAIGKIEASALQGVAFVGELSLTGAVRAVRGVLPMVQAAAAGGARAFVVPRDNLREASEVPDIAISDTANVSDLLDSFSRCAPPPPVRFAPTSNAGWSAGPDLADVRAAPHARRALEVAAAGGHNVLLVGAVNVGKTMLARRLPGLLPLMTREEALEVTAVLSVGGLLPADQGLRTVRPFRAPHHTVSTAGLVGGGDPIRPGEVSLAHHGVLFLDEMNEFKASVLDGLLEPLDRGVISLYRGRKHVAYPARALVVGAIHPCPCGYLGALGNRCKCTPERIHAYRARGTGAVYDAFDMQVAIQQVSMGDFRGAAPGETSSAVRERVSAARERQLERVWEDSALSTNGRYSPVAIERCAQPDADGMGLLNEAHLSKVANRSVLRVARTIADLDGSGGVKAMHVAEALGFRALDTGAL